jgi:hypothetical protein
MFKRIKERRERKKKLEKEISSAIIIFIVDSKINIEVQIKDDTEESLEDLATLLSCYEKSMLIEFLLIIRKQYSEQDDLETYSILIDKLVSKIGVDFLTKDEYDEPFIDPESII